MGDRGQVTGDKCGVVTRAGDAGDKRPLGCRAGDTSALNGVRTQTCRKPIRVIDATTHRIRRVIEGIAATELVSNISRCPRCFQPRRRLAACQLVVHRGWSRRHSAPIAPKREEKINQGQGQQKRTPSAPLGVLMGTSGSAVPVGRGRVPQVLSRE
jgi:hypothetical protein